MDNFVTLKHKYPYIEGDITLYIFKSYGLIKFNNKSKPLRVSKDTIELLIQFNGTKKSQEIINNHVNSEQRGDDLEIYKAIIAIAKLINEEIVKFNDQPIKIKPYFIKYNGFYPESLHVELTTKCNLKCTYCYRNSDSNITEERLSTDKLIEILTSLSERGLQVVELTGGEPLLHPDFIRILKFCGETFKITSILTNGTLIDHLIIKEMLPFREKLVVGISLDSHIPKEHDARCGQKGTFEKVINAIHLLVKKDFRVRIAMAVDELNWKDIEQTLLFSRNLGVTAFTYSPIVPFGRAKNSFKFWDLDAKKVLKEEKYLHTKYKDFIHLMPESSLEKLKKPGHCGAGHRSYAIDPSGNVRLCVTFDSNTGVLGSLKNQKVETIFNHELAIVSSKLIAPSQKICGICKFASFCRNCILRGFVASQWIEEGKCAWIRQSDVNEWANLVKKNTIVE